MEKKKKRTEKRKLTELLNPYNLEKEIDSYGYKFSMGKYATMIFISLIATIALGSVFSLQWEYILFLTVSFLLFLPGMILNGYKNMYEHRKFLDVADYMEQVLYSFKADQKILTALRDTETLFDGRMKKVIQESATYIENGHSKNDLYREAFEKIENEYPDKHLRMVHDYMQTVERNGGDSDASVDMLLHIKNIWADNVLLLQEEKKQKRGLVLAALILTIGFAAMFHAIYRGMPQQFNIVNLTPMQIVTTVYLFCNLVIYRKANRAIAKSWTERDSEKEEKKILRYYDAILHFDGKKEQKKSLLYSLPFWGIALLCFAFGKTIFAAGFVAFSIFMLNQHRIGYRIAYDKVVEEINAAFPQWLMQMALLLQSNNVRRSIEESISGSPRILKTELEMLVNSLKETPNSERPYLEFLKRFHLSAVQSAMKMLYSISTLGSGEVQTQVKALVERNSKLLDQSEKKRNEKNLAGITSLFYLPQLTVSLQLLAGMFLMLLTFFTGLTSYF